jgi:aminoglycoside 6'-N-acetyltransferase
MDVIEGAAVRLRPATADDLVRLVAIRSTPEVHRRSGGTDLRAELAKSLADDDPYLLAVEDTTRHLIGAIQWEEEEEEDYRHASIDVFLDPAVHGRGLGTDAVATLARHLFEHQGHHRITIDPAADNAAAIRCYEKVGFRSVGVMRRYERGPDGIWHDGLLMDLLAEDLPAEDLRL